MAEPTTAGNGHKPHVQPITDEQLTKLAEQMQGIFAQALREATDNRKGDLVGKGKTVADLVANIENAAFREGLKDFLLWLKIITLLGTLQDPTFDILTKAEYQELHDYLAYLQEQARRGQEKPPP